MRALCLSIDPPAFLFTFSTALHGSTLPFLDLGTNIHVPLPFNYVITFRIASLQSGASLDGSASLRVG